MLSIRKRKQPAVDSTETTPLQLKKKRWTGRILNTGKKGNTITERNSKESPLLRLPAELRTQIYKLVLCPETLHVHGPYDGGERNRYVGISVYPCSAEAGDGETVLSLRHSTVDLSPAAQDAKCYHKRYIGCGAHGIRETQFLALLQTCRQIHNEAALLPFHEGSFSFRSISMLPLFLEKLLVAQRKARRKITLPPLSLFMTQRSKAATLAGLKEITMFNEHGGSLLVGALKECLPIVQSCEITKAVLCIILRSSAGSSTGVKQADMPAICDEMEAMLVAGAGAEEG